MRHIARSAALIFALVIVTPIAVVAGLLSRRERSTRSLWVTHPIPTVPAKARAERSLGYQVTTWAFDTNRLEDRFDRVLSVDRTRRFIGVLTPFVAFVHACARFDRLHFFCDRGLLPLFTPRVFDPWELTLYRLLGKQVFFWAYGADVRTQSTTRATGEPNACSFCPCPGQFCVCSDQRGQLNQQRIARTATAVFSMGDMKVYTPGSVNDLFYWPIDLDDARFDLAVPVLNPEQPIRIVHAPNHRHFKGTHLLIDAVNALKNDGIAIDLDLVEGVSNDEALTRYRAADLVFDQCLIGFHGYFALEAMAMGKPVMCFLRDRQADVIAPDECPLINVSPNSLEHDLRTVIADPSNLPEIGRAGRVYIERYYSIPAFADRYQQTLRSLGVHAS